MLAKRVEQGLSAPAWDRRPELFDDLVPVWGAFWVLSAGREHGFDGPQPIRASDVAAHFEIEETPQDERAEWYALIRALDAAYLKDSRKRRERARKAEEARKRGNAQGRNRRA